MLLESPVEMLRMKSSQSAKIDRFNATLIPANIVWSKNALSACICPGSTLSFLMDTVERVRACDRIDDPNIGEDSTCRVDCCFVIKVCNTARMEVCRSKSPRCTQIQSRGRVAFSMLANSAAVQSPNEVKDSSSETAARCKGSSLFNTSVPEVLSQRNISLKRDKP